MATKKKVGVKVPTLNEISRKYGGMIVNASETQESKLTLSVKFHLLKRLKKKHRLLFVYRG